MLIALFEMKDFQCVQAQNLETIDFVFLRNALCLVDHGS